MSMTRIHRPGPGGRKQEGDGRHTLVVPGLHEYLEQKARELKVLTVDVRDRC